jgi:hypothetical protein
MFSLEKRVIFIFPSGIPMCPAMSDASLVWDPPEKTFISPNMRPPTARASLTGRRAILSIADF